MVEALGSVFVTAWTRCDGCAPIIPACRRWRREVQQFKLLLRHVVSLRLAGLGYMRSCLKNKKEKKEEMEGGERRGAKTEVGGDIKHKLPFWQLHSPALSFSWALWNLSLKASILFAVVLSTLELLHSLSTSPASAASHSLPVLTTPSLTKQMNQKPTSTGFPHPAPLLSSSSQ